MSLGSAAGSFCCGYSSGGLVQIEGQQDPCTMFHDCQNLIVSAIDAILTLRTPGGSTASETLDQVSLTCPNLANVTLLEIQQALNVGAKRGIFRRVARSDGQTAYMVLSAMVQLNGANSRYMRPLCQLYQGRGSGTLASGTLVDSNFSTCCSVLVQSPCASNKPCARNSNASF